MAVDFESFKAYIESDGEIEFDMYAQDLEEFAWLKEFIPGIVISSAGGIGMFQAEGLIEGLPFYYRDRHGYASLRVGSADGEFPYLGDTTFYSAGTPTPEFEGGEHFIKNLMKLVGELKKSQFPNEFRGKKLIFKNDKSWGYEISETEFEDHVGWGFTPAEGWDQLMIPSEYLAEHGCTPDIQLQMFLDRDYSKTPVVTDEREYPEIPVIFRVNF